MIAHFFDIESVLVNSGKVWIVDKYNLNTFIMKLDQSDFNLIRNGIYKPQRNKLNIGGTDYWFPNDIFDEIKLKCKIHKVNITHLLFSMKEFLDDELIDTMNYDINLENILHLKNTTDSIYFICSENTKSNYEKFIKKIEKKLEDNGLFIKKYYFISETFYSRDTDEIAYKKIRLLLQHLIGIKSEVDKFIDEEVDCYDEVNFYDTDEVSIKLATDANDLLQLLISNSANEIKDDIKLKLKDDNKTLIVNLVTPNKVNKFLTTKVKIEYHNLIKTFEKFNWRK
jgi:hypothetical protein